MRLNAEEGDKRKFIMAQLPEVCGPDTEAAKAAYKNICEIGKERIRRAVFRDSIFACSRRHIKQESFLIHYRQIGL